MWKVDDDDDHFPGVASAMGASGVLAVLTVLAMLVTGVLTVTGAMEGSVSVTVVGVGPQCVQTVTTVFQSVGREGAAVRGQYVVVYVVVTVVKPVGQMSIYDVATTVVTVLGAMDSVPVVEGAPLGPVWEFVVVEAGPEEVGSCAPGGLACDEKKALEAAEELDVGLPEIIVLLDVVEPSLLDNLVFGVLDGVDATVELLTEGALGVTEYELGLLETEGVVLLEVGGLESIALEVTAVDKADELDGVYDGV